MVTEIPTTTEADGAVGTDDVVDPDTIFSNPGVARSRLEFIILNPQSTFHETQDQ